MSYYLKLRDRAYGPFTLEKLRSMIQRGNVDAASQISTDKKTWRAAESFPELFGQTQVPAQPPQPAYQEAPAAPAAYQDPNAYQGAAAYQGSNPYQQGAAAYQGSNPYQQGAAAYQAPNAYQGAAAYQDPNAYQSAAAYQDPNAYQSAAAYQAPNAYQGAAAYQDPNAYQGAPSGDASAACWFLSLDGQTGSGPYAADVLYEAVRSGQANADSLVWRNGENARAMRDDPQFAHLFASPNAAFNGSDANTQGYGASQQFPSLIAERISKRFKSYWISALLLFVIPLLGGIGAAVASIATEDPEVLALIIIPCFYLAPIVCGLLAQIFFLMFIHAFWRALPPRYASTTPGSACGLLLVPVFCLYWNFIVFCQGSSNANRALQDVTPNGASRPQISETLALLYSISMIVFPIVGFFLSFSLLNQMRQVGIELCAVASRERAQTPQY